jgi:hypothetical protein
MKNSKRTLRRMIEGHETEKLWAIAVGQMITSIRLAHFSHRNGQTDVARCVNFIGMSTVLNLGI